MQSSRSNLYLGLVCIVFAMLVLFIWIPLDVESSWVEKVRGRYRIGDALAPTIAAGFILVGGALLVLFERRASDQPAIQPTQLRFLLRLMGVVLLSLLVMRFAGPLAVAVSNHALTESNEYRLLRNTFPWKYIGFVLGGVMLVAGVISLVERRISIKAVITAVVAVLFIILVFDLPFDDLLLPPNGDV